MNETPELEPVAAVPVPADETQRLTCFVIGPIGNQFAPHGSEARRTYEDSLRIWSEVIQPACERVGLDAVRADQLAQPGEITEQIFRRLHDDDVVIADLTGANANVMYELGLRHTRDKLTVQIGEYDRLPFDVTVIRTIQFSRSDIGLINARDKLIEALETGLAGEFDPVTATRVWSGGADALASADGEPSTRTPVDSGGADAPDEPGFLDVLAEGESKQDEFVESLHAVNRWIVRLGEVARESADDVERSDARGGGMRGRLAIAARYASHLEDIADNLEREVDRYVQTMATFDAVTRTLISRLEEEPESLEEPNGRDYALVTRQLAHITRDSLESLSGLVASIKENARLARVLRGPSGRITAALDRFGTMASVADEWDRRLQALGVPTPADDWEPEWDADDDAHDPLAEPSAGNSGAEEPSTPETGRHPDDSGNAHG